MNIMNENTLGINAQGLMEQAKAMVKVVEDALEQRRAAHEVERSLFRCAMQMGRRALGLFFQLCGNGDRGEIVELPQVGRLKRLAGVHCKAYRSVFGEYALERVVYGIREGQKIAYVPLDEQLQLPEGKCSYLLQDWNQSLAVEMPYNQVNGVLERVLGFTQSVNSLERSNAKLAASVPEYWEVRAPASEAQGKEIVVATVDCKGGGDTQDKCAGRCQASAVEGLQRYDVRRPTGGQGHAEKGTQKDGGDRFGLHNSALCSHP